jgi:hypothetical protein
MGKIPGRLIVDLLPDGKMHLVFPASSADKNASSIKAKDIDAAGSLFLNCGLSVECTSALISELNRNKVASVGISVNEEIAARFRYTIPTM